jgi:hypothetical protein
MKIVDVVHTFKEGTSSFQFEFEDGSIAERKYLLSFLSKEKSIWVVKDILFNKGVVFINELIAIGLILVLFCFGIYHFRNEAEFNDTSSAGYIMCLLFLAWFTWYLCTDFLARAGTCLSGNSLTAIVTDIEHYEAGDSESTSIFQRILLDVGDKYSSTADGFGKDKFSVGDEILLKVHANGIPFVVEDDKRVMHLMLGLYPVFYLVFFWLISTFELYYIFDFRLARIGGEVW